MALPFPFAPAPVVIGLTTSERSRLVIIKKRFALPLLVSCVAASAAEPAVDGLARTIWAESLPGGPVKAVFLAPYGAQQDSFELMQRFDIDGQVITMASRDTHGYLNALAVVGHYWPQLWPTRQQIRQNIREAVSAEWDAVVMSWTPVWSQYPEDIRRSILEKVSSGRVLVIGSLHGALRTDIAEMGLELEETAIGAERFAVPDSDQGGILSEPAVPGAPGPAGHVYRCGQGRVVHLHMPNYAGHGYLLSDSPRQSDFEFSAGRAGWFLHRAARPGAARFVTATHLTEGHVMVYLDGQPALRDGSVQVTVHRCDTYQKVLDATRKTEPGERVAVPLPQLADGEHQAEVRVTNGGGKTLDWDAIRFTITGRVILRAIVPDRQEVKPGEKVRCRLDVEGETEGLETVVRWFDHWDRLLLSTDPRLFSTEVEVTVPAGSLSVMNHLEVTLRSDRGPETVGRAEMLIPENVRPTDFYMLYWKNIAWKESLPGSWRRRLRWDVLRRRGAADAWSNCKATVVEVRDAALSHLRTVPYTVSFHKVTLDGQRDPLLGEEYLATMEKNVRQLAAEMRPYNPLAHTLGDENYVTHEPEGRLANTPRAWVAFREYLRGIYPDIEALNAQWETELSTWDAVRFDNEAQMLANLDNPSAWVDYRMFVTHHFTEAHRRMRQALREGHPGVSVGWDGAVQFSSYNGQDWWELCRDMEMVNTYQDGLIADVGFPLWIFNGEAIGSFGRNARLRGCWMNRADRDYGGQYVPWYLLLNGWNSTWWWQATFLHPANGPLRWDMDSTPIAAPMVAAVKQIKRGPGTLLANARKAASRVAVHYSATNYHASTIESGVADYLGNLGRGAGFWMAPELAARSSDEAMRTLWGGITPKGHYAAASSNFYLLLSDMGFEPRTIARQEIEAGALATSDIRLLVLPFVVSLSDLEVQRIREFLGRGGILIADYRCGLRDEHGRMREKPALDDVFGIRRESLEVRRGRGTFTGNYGVASAQFQTVFHDPVALDGAESFGYHDDGTPGCFVNYALGGKALYLNTDLYGYVDLRRRGSERDVRKLITAFLTVRDHLIMFPSFQVKHRQGHAAARVEVTRFADGNTRYYGVLPAFDVDDKAPRPVTIPLPAGTHVYDVRAQKYLGPGGTMEATLYPGRPEMYAALPYVIEGLSVRAPQRVRRGEPVEIQIAVAAGTDDIGPHAVRIEVNLPDGRKVEYLGRTLYLSNGEGVFSFVPALNSSIGHWTVTAVEAVSDKQASAGFEVR